MDTAVKSSRTSDGTATTMAKESIHPTRGADYVDDMARWLAVVTRDHAADGAFYYSVRTTGVYCRPSCAARLPKRTNVAFHPIPAAAEAAGFRACKRCRPNDVALATQHAAGVAKACRLMKTAETMPHLDALAAAAGMSRFHFHRVFKTLTGVTPKAYGDRLRAQRVAHELPESNTVTDALYSAGFNSSGRFYANYPELLGMTPRAFQRRGSGQVIRYAFGKCSLGTVLVAATARGVCAIQFGDDRKSLIDALREQFTDAELISDDAGFGRIVEFVVAL
ncbi:MAG: bifunctional transcriptional activator/DNA repair enzyme AdaA, partial [Gammaproteobacteria bacterium]